jgi:hypothetical protein
MLSSKPQARQRLLRVAVSTLTTMLVLAACGGGSGSTDSTVLASSAGLAEAGAVVVDGNNGNTGSTGTDNTGTGSTGTGNTGTGSTGNTGTGNTDGGTGGNTGGSTGGNTGGSTTPQTVTIDYYGDSTVWGYRSVSGGQVATPAPAAFAAALPSTTRYVVRNEGVSATTACQLLNGTDGRHPRWETQLANSTANVVIVNHAINDEWQMDLVTYKGCLTSLAQKAKQAGKKIVFETPNPTRDSYASGLDTWAQATRDVARAQSVPVIDQYQYLKDYLAGANPLTICPDGLHPTDAVYIMKGKYAASVWSSLGL